MSPFSFFSPGQTLAFNARAKHSRFNFLFKQVDNVDSLVLILEDVFHTVLLESHGNADDERQRRSGRICIRNFVRDRVDCSVNARRHIHRLLLNLLLVPLLHILRRHIIA